MKLKFLLFICLVFLCLSSAKAIESEYTMHMDTLPYYEIPDAPEMYNAATVAARMVDGLGFRYYWATEGLRAEDLAHEPGNDGQSCSSVIEHVLGLSRFVLRTVKGEVHDNTREYPELNFEGQRTETLKNLKEASEILRNTGDLSAKKIVFKRGDTTSEMPFWNILNGPLSDAIYHTGQIVSFRRTTGNPTNTNISQFRGKVKQ